ncbi:hypothetical protein Dimus_022368 [Dionaea muscipula]
MRFKSSSPSSVSNYAEQLYTHKSPALGCLFPVFRRILCSGGLPTYPLDHPKESEIHQQQQSPCFSPEKIEGGWVSPSLVARLMGLNSMPTEYHFDNAGEKVRNSIARSKSMSSVEWGLEEEEKTEAEYGRRLKTSRSLREMSPPVCLEIEDDDFLVIRLDNEGEFESGSRKCNTREDKQRKRTDRRILKQRKQSDRSTCSDEEEEERISLKISAERIGTNHVVGIQSPCPSIASSIIHNISSMVPMAVTGEQIRGEMTRSRKKKKKKGKCVGERESESQNSSPVSVLDQSEFTGDPEVSTPEEDSRSRTCWNPLMNLMSEILYDELASDYSIGRVSKSDVLENSSSEGKTPLHQRYNLTTRLHDHDLRQFHSTWIFVKVSKMAETDLLALDWMHRERKKLVDDVGAELGSQIFDQLIDEVVAELLRRTTNST